MTTPRRVTWGIHAARRIAAARGIEPAESEIFARALVPKIADIAYQIALTEKRRGPREIALFMLRQVAGRHAHHIPDLIENAEPADAADLLLYWATEGLHLAADNPNPERTPPSTMRISVFHADGRRTAWDRIV
ncbi:hypothetical protein, partial [Mesorhizobium sp. M8A.F.Ca.ET.021.01.1.1]|uniref:hypothetical protein n=1 Tax=Mesorhizobium sp. M8A.F.Ca.ET.021.01.1.1 TaxID=2496757 RepID=UPI000FD34C58